VEGVVEGVAEPVGEPLPEAVDKSVHFEQVACHECDLLLSLAKLREGDRAVCPRCGFTVSSRSRNGLQRAMAYAVAALVLLLLANMFPFLSLETKGLESEMTLPRAIVDLHEAGFALMGALVIAFIVVIPAVVAVLVTALAIPLALGQNRPWLRPAARLIYTLTTWSMAEGFIIGVIVSLVKIGQMATVIIGVSFWAYAAFSICFTAAVASLDRLEVWDEIERLSS